MNVVKMTLKKNNDAKVENIRLKFICAAENVPNLLKVMEEKATLKRKSGCKDENKEKKSKLNET